MSIWQIVLFALFALWAWGLSKRMYYHIRYPGRYVFSKHYLILNSEEAGRLCALMLHSIVNNKEAVEAAKADSLPPEIVAIMEDQLKESMSFFDRLQRRFCISPTFKVDFKAFKEKKEADIKKISDFARLQQLRVPEDGKKGN